MNDEAKLRGKKPDEGRRAQIFEAAAALFYKQGYDATGIQDIADQIGILKGSLYHYIESKEDLLLYVVREIHQLRQANIAKWRLSDASPRDRLYGVVCDHVINMIENRAKAHVYLRDLDALSERRRQEILFGGDTYVEFVSHLIDEMSLANNHDSSPYSRLAALFILGSASWVCTWWSEEDGLAPEDVARHFAAQAVNSVEHLVGESQE